MILDQLLNADNLGKRCQKSGVLSYGLEALSLNNRKPMEVFALLGHGVSLFRNGQE